ncbi:MAG: hypothetical protein ALECFALPRED_002428 [Alectoria fallacina]|uniref:Uncharacterized protein n=1 Tax=Alectoria fallacina TaxID=1903189 RepID=A0A8H3HXI6_9LECA|nr:MAG: hypothetical protein ALECFALPRED_002428 [Alectoria fallacina]
MGLLRNVKPILATTAAAAAATPAGAGFEGETAPSMPKVGVFCLQAGFWRLKEDVSGGGGTRWYHWDLWLWESLSE